MGKVPKNAVFALFDSFYQVIWKIDLFYLVGNFLENILKKIFFLQNCIFTPLWRHKGVKIAHFWPFSRKNRLYRQFKPVKVYVHSIIYILSYVKFYEDFKNGIENSVTLRYDVIMTSYVLTFFVIFDHFCIKYHFLSLKTYTIPLFDGFYGGFYRFLWYLSAYDEYFRTKP